MLGVSEAIWAPMLVLAAMFGAAALIGRRRIPIRKEPKVFVSYNHEDAEVAVRLHRLLEGEGISVLIDSENMRAGERIQDFIAQSIRQSDVVVSLVSGRSLRSAWVAMETIQALQRNRLRDGHKFIACYLDESFYAPECRLQFTERIDERIRRIEELLPDYSAKRIDTIDLNEEKTRLYELRNNLGLILATLKTTLCLDMRGGRFEESVKRLVTAIRAGTDRPDEARRAIFER